MMQGSGKGEKVILPKWLKFLFRTRIDSLCNIISMWLQGDRLNIFFLQLVNDFILPSAVCLRVTECRFVKVLSAYSCT